MRKGYIFNGVLSTAVSYYVTSNNLHTLPLTFLSAITDHQTYEQGTFLSLHLRGTNPPQKPCSGDGKMPAITLTIYKLAV